MSYTQMDNIKANYIDIHESVEIGKNVQINCDSIKIGKFSKIGYNVKINCKKYFPTAVVVKSPESKFGLIVLLSLTIVPPITKSTQVLIALNSVSSDVPSASL